MGPVQRWARRMLNPWSTAVTTRWYGGWRDPVSPTPVYGPLRSPGASGIQAFFLERSPGSWEAPAGKRPGWSWLPPGGAHANIRRMPWWVRLWYMTPLIDRYAYEWMWWHGGWAVVPRDGGDSGGGGGGGSGGGAGGGGAAPGAGSPPGGGSPPDAGSPPDGGVREPRRPRRPNPAADVRIEPPA